MGYSSIPIKVNTYSSNVYSNVCVQSLQCLQHRSIVHNNDNNNNNNNNKHLYRVNSMRICSNARNKQILYKLNITGSESQLVGGFLTKANQAIGEEMFKI